MGSLFRLRSRVLLLGFRRRSLSLSSSSSSSSSSSTSFSTALLHDDHTSPSYSSTALLHDVSTSISSHSTNLPHGGHSSTSNSYSAATFLDDGRTSSSSTTIDVATFSSSEDEDETPQTSIHPPLPPSSSTLLRALHRLILNTSIPSPSTSLPSTFTIPSLSSALSRLSPSPLPSPLLHRLILTSSSNPRHFPPTLALFNWWLLSSTPTPSPSDLLSDPFHAIVDFAAKARAFPTAWSLLSDMVRRGVPIPTRTALQLVRRYSQAGLPAEAADAFLKLEHDDYGFHPNPISFSLALAALSTCPSSGPHAQALFDRFRSRFPPDVTTYTSLIHAWCLTDRLDEAERVFAEMESAGIAPNLYTYTLVVDALCRAGQLDRAQEVVAQMLADDCPPNAAIFNPFIEAHLRAGCNDDALEVFVQMMMMGYTPDSTTYNLAIRAHCRLGNLYAALNMLHNMGSEANVASFNRILRCVAKLGDAHTTSKLHARMKEIGCEPNVLTYNLFMESFARSKSVDKVMRTKRNMDKNGVEPNVNTYGALIPMFCEMHDCNQVYKLMLEMLVDKCLEPKESMIQMALACLRKAQRLKEHWDLVEKLDARGFLTPTSCDVPVGCESDAEVGELEECCESDTEVGEPE